MTTPPCAGSCLRLAESVEEDPGFGVFQQANLRWVRTRPCSCAPEECPNFEFCGFRLPARLLRRRPCGVCVECGKRVGGRRVCVVATAAASPCAVCREEHCRFARFPAGCTHRFCVECTRKVCFETESIYHLDPMAFGAPDCPHPHRNCVSRPCCDDDVRRLDEWYSADQAAYDRWIDEERERVKVFPHTAFGRGVCPLCRALASRELAGV